MANTKKYVSLDKLSLYNEKIKKVIADGDSATLASAKSYADGLAVNYDAAGAAATAKSEAIAHADAEVAKANAAAAAAQTAADNAAAAAATADGKAVAAQTDVDNLESYVGTFTASEGVDTVVKYIDAKTANIASDETVTAIADRITQAEKDIDAIEADYLKAADKTELSTAINTEKERATGIESGLRTDVDAIAEDYLKAADKTELANAVAAEKTRAEGIEGGLRTDVDAIKADYLKSTDKEALQTQINTIMNNPDAEGAINSINEFTQYVKDHGTIAEGFRTDIDKNKEDIAANTKAIEDHKTLAAQTYATKTELANEKKALQDEIDADVKVVADDLTELEGVVTGLGNTKADKTALDEAVEALEGADEELSGRIATLEGKFGGAEGSIEDQIEDAKKAAIDAAAADATSKANAAESAAKGHADSLNTAMNTRVEALEAIDHSHSNKAELDLIATGDKAKWDASAAIAHEHGNKTVIDGITAAKVAAWDASEGNAKTYADGLNTAMNTRVDTLESWHENFVECSQEDIQALFA